MKKYIIYAFCLLAFTWGCSGNKTDSHEGHEHGHEEHDHSHEDGEKCDDHDHGSDEHTDEIIFTAQQAKASGLEVITVSPAQFYQVIKTSGQVLSASGDEITISATASGIVSFTKGSLTEGLSVRGGESLLAISSKNIVDGDPIAKAKSVYTIAQQEYERAESLIKDKLISEKEYNEIKLNYENAKIAYQGSSRNQTSKGAGISSPISGFIKSKLINEGQYVEVGQPLFTITQNRKLQLRADVSERYYKDLKTIHSANFKTPYDNTTHQLSVLNGRLVSYGKSAGTDSYYIPVTFEFDNIGDIVSGSYVEVYLLGQPRANIIAIPASSLVEEQGLYFVYKQLDAEGYQKQEVKIGSRDGEKVEILSGLQEGEIVVSKGAYHVKLASASESIPHGHEH